MKMGAESKEKMTLPLLFVLKNTFPKPQTAQRSKTMSCAVRMRRNIANG